MTKNNDVLNPILILNIIDFVIIIVLFLYYLFHYP